VKAVGIPATTRSMRKDFRAQTELSSKMLAHDG